MLLYRWLRWVAGVALRWYYRRIDVVGLERVPADAPLLIAANHPNQLVDAMLVAYALQRPVTFTGKAVLLDNPVARVMLRHLPFVPLRRAGDERKASPAPATAGPGNAPDPARNADAFRAIVDALAAGGAVLVFPEGISHHRPQLAPMKTGIARIALQARDDRGVRGLCILPVGLTFEQKEEPRTRVLVEVGEPLAMDGWQSTDAPVDGLTRDVDERLRAITLNFPTVDAAERVLRVSRLLAELSRDARPLDEEVRDAPYTPVVDVTRRVDAVRRSIERPGTVDANRVDRFQARLDAFERSLAEHDVIPADVGIAVGVRPGARFLLREGAIALAAGPLALWGRLNHWIPLRLARLVAARSSRAPEDPAMHTLVVGLAAVVLFYALQTTLVGMVAGPLPALAYLLTLVPSADWDFRLRDRHRRALARVRTYLRFRRDPALRARLLEEMAWLRGEAAEIERMAVERGQARREAMSEK